MIYYRVTKVGVRVPRVWRKAEPVCGPYPLLQFFEDVKSQERFPELLACTPLSKQTVEQRDLEKLLRDTVATRCCERVELGPPDLLSHESVAFYELRFRRKKLQISVLDLAAVYRFLDIHSVGANELKSVFVRAFEEGGTPCSRKQSLLKYFAGEWHLNNLIAVYLKGRWFQLNANHLNRCRETLKSLPDLTYEWRLPIMNRSQEAKENEDEYNLRLAKEKDWLLLHKGRFSLGGHQKLEICDHLTGDGDLVFVKRATGSDVQSHLYAQAAVSAAQYRSNSKFRAALETEFQKRWPGRRMPETPRIVLAVSTPKPEPLWSGLFGFSAIHLVAQVNRIRCSNFTVALCAIRESNQRIQRPTVQSARHNKAA